MSYEIAKGQYKFKYGMANPDQLEAWLKENPDIVGVSFVGRSNVGKSSTINSLFGRKTARTSKTPGRTREINIFTMELTQDGKPTTGLPTLYFFDLPGYGHAKVGRQIAENWNNLMSTFFSFISPNVLIINLQDARHPDQKADQDFHKYLKEFDLETVLAFNKIDKLKTQKDRAALNKLKPALFSKYKWVAQIHFISAESLAGLQALHDNIINYIFNKID